MKHASVYIYVLCIFLGYSCSQKKQTSNLGSEIKNDTIINIESNTNIGNGTFDSNFNVSLIDAKYLELKRIYTDTVVFQQYMDYGDFDRFHVIARGKKLYPLNSDDDRSLNRGDVAVLKWTVDSIWIPEAPNDKWLSEFSKGIRKIKDGKLSLYKKKYPQPISYYYDESIRDKYSKEDFDEIHNLVQYYLANSIEPLVISSVKNQSDSEQIQYSIEEQEREENRVKATYTMIGLSNYSENRNSIFQWLYLKQNNNGYKDIYEYDLSNDKLSSFN